MKRTLSLLVFAIFVTFPLAIFSQTSIIQDSKLEIPNYKMKLSDQFPIFENEDHFVQYHMAFGYGTMNDYHALIFYNKSRKTIYEEKLTLPVGCRYICSQVTGSEITLFYYKIDRKVQKCTIYSATASLSRSSNGIQNITPEEITSYKLTKKTEVMTFSTQSPDKNKNAFAVAFIEGNNLLKGIHIHTFGDQSQLLWSNYYTPELKGNYFSIEDVKISNKGKVLVLFSTAVNEKKKILNSVAQLISFNNQDVVTMEYPSKIGTFTSMRMLVQRNGNYMVAGYYSDKKYKTAGYFTAVFDERAEDLRYSNVHAFEFAKKTTTESDINPNWTSVCHQLYELDNDFMAMIGEQIDSQVSVDAESGEKTYTYTNGNILCTLFSNEGTNAGTESIRKQQTAIVEQPLTYKDRGERHNSGVMATLSSASSVETFYAYHHFGLSFSTLVKGHEFYFIYADNINNYNDKKNAEEWQTWELDKYKEHCLVMAKLANIGDVERKVLMLPAKQPRIFNTTWFVDDMRAFIGVYNKKSYNLYHFDIDGQWDWD